jgi:hypothetical protein
MSNITKIMIHPSFLGKDIYVSREVRDVLTRANFGQTVPGFREYGASSEKQPSFIIRIEKLKNAPKPNKRQKVKLIDPAVTYVEERNRNNRTTAVPIIVAEVLELLD